MNTYAHAHIHTLFALTRMYHSLSCALAHILVGARTHRFTHAHSHSRMLTHRKTRMHAHMCTHVKRRMHMFIHEHEHTLIRAIFAQ